MSYDIKQVIVIRKDLKMRRGKEIAQAAHASMAFLSNKLNNTFINVLMTLSLSKVEKRWLQGSFAKIAVYVNSLEEFKEVEEKAREAKLQVHVITDNGKTEFHNTPTITAMAIGPDYTEKIDPITGHLKLA